LEKERQKGKIRNEGKRKAVTDKNVNIYRVIQKEVYTFKHLFYKYY
jgi:hypothetical protein